MFNFEVIRHDDYHGDPICFSIVDEDGHGRGRFPSEIEAIEWLPYLEALAEDEERNPRLPRWEVVLPVCRVGFTAVMATAAQVPLKKNGAIARTT